MHCCSLTKMEFKFAVDYVLEVGLMCLVCVAVIYTADVDPTPAKPASFPDKLFSNMLMVYGKDVYCAQDHTPGNFPAQTWTCRDMRVDGKRMAYGYNPNLYKDHKCVETGGFDELGELCRKMMSAINSDKLLWVAMVTNATCNYIAEERMLLNFTDKGYEWHSMKAGYGWVDTLQCMGMK